MKNLKLSSLLFVSSIALLALFNFSCSKDRIDNRSLNAYDSPNSYLDSKKQDEQEFVVDTSGSSPIVGNQGTKIWTGKECLMYANGDSVHYPFIVKLVELYKPADMIYYQMPTVASNKILETGGEIRLRVFKNNVELALRPNGCYNQVEMPNAAPKANYMSVYNGVANSTFVNWVPNNPVNPFTATAYGYMAQITKLGWINCDKDASSTPSHTVSFSSTVDDLTNVAFFIYFPNTKTVMQVYNTTSGAIPHGSNVKIIGLGLSGGQLYSFYTTQTVNADAQIDVALSATTDANFTALLNGL